MLPSMGETKVLTFCDNINLKMSNTPVCILKGIFHLAQWTHNSEKVNLNRLKADFAAGLEITPELEPATA